MLIAVGDYPADGQVLAHRAPRFRIERRLAAGNPPPNNPPPNNPPPNNPPPNNPPPNDPPPNAGEIQPNTAGKSLTVRQRLELHRRDEICASCHKKDFCVDCHSGVQKPMDFHAGDYVNMHAIDARRNSPDCASCHRLQTFCQACHSRLGVAADGKGSEFGPTTALYHPPGWTEAGLAGRGPTHHAFEAQRNIKQCVSCHRA